VKAKEKGQGLGDRWRKKRKIGLNELKAIPRLGRGRGIRASNLKIKRHIMRLVKGRRWKENQSGILASILWDYR